MEGKGRRRQGWGRAAWEKRGNISQSQTEILNTPVWAHKHTVSLSG